VRDLNIVLLGGDSESTRIVGSALYNDVGLDAVILEGADSRLRLLRRRASKLGWWTAAGQAVFTIYSRPLMQRSQLRRAEIAAANNLTMTLPQDLPVVRVPSVNSEQTVSLLRDFNAKVVVVNGTRIISRTVLQSVGSCFINTHAGITPKYRGVHGGYWALANGDPDNAGVTVHLVDPGIDTGGVLYQATIHPTPEDNFCTYPLLQLAAGIPLLKRAVRDALEGKLKAVSNGLPSRLYYHPTIWTYLKTRARSGVK